MPNSIYFLYITTAVLVLLLFIILIYNYSNKTKRIHNQVALVTGGANGLGRQICMKLAKQGCKIAIVDIDYSSALNTAQFIRKNYESVQVGTYQCDVSKLEAIEGLKRDVEGELGPVDILVNNAAIIFEDPLLDVEPNHLQKMLNVNCLALFWTTRVFLPGMIDRKQGHIVSIASLSALTGAPFMLMYATTKFAVRGFMESLALDLEANGHGAYIKTTTVFPSFTNTNKGIDEFVDKGFKIKWILEVEQVAKNIVGGMLRNNETVFIPGVMKYVGYLLTVPLWIRKVLINRLTVKGFKTNANQIEKMVTEEREQNRTSP